MIERIVLTGQGHGMSESSNSRPRIVIVQESHPECIPIHFTIRASVNNLRGQRQGVSRATRVQVRMA